MRLCVPVTAAALFLIVFSADTAHSAEVELRAFVGTWQENPAKSHHVISSALTYTFAEEADGFVTIVRGGIQLRDRVRFDGKDYPTPGMMEWPPKVRQPVKAQNPSKGELSHGVVEKEFH